MTEPRGPAPSRAMATPSEATPGIPFAATRPDANPAAMFAAIAGEVPHPVMVAVDGTGLSERAAHVAARVARARGATLVLVRAVPGTARHGLFSYLLEDHDDDVRHARTDLLHLADALHYDFPGLRAEVQVTDGPPAAAVVGAMRRARVGLGVVATRGRPAVARTFGGSVAGDIARDSGAATLVLWPSAVDRLTTDEWRDDTLVIAPTSPVGRRVLVPMAEAARHPRVVAEAFRMARAAAGEVVLLAGLDVATRVAASDLAEEAERSGLDARVAVAALAGWVGVAAAIMREGCDVVAMPAVATIPGMRPGLSNVHRDIVTRAPVPLLCVPDLPDGDGRGLATAYPDVPSGVLAAARPLSGTGR